MRLSNQSQSSLLLEVTPASLWLLFHVHTRALTHPSRQVLLYFNSFYSPLLFTIMAFEYIWKGMLLHIAYSLLSQISTPTRPLATPAT